MGVPIDERDPPVDSPATESAVVSCLGEAQYHIGEAIALIQAHRLNDLEVQGRLMTLIMKARGWLDRAGREGSSSRYSAVAKPPSIKK